MKFYEVYKQSYYDSVTLMSLTARIERQYEGSSIFVGMATPMNQDLLANLGFILKNLESNDLIVAATDVDEGVFERIKVDVHNELTQAKKASVHNEYLKVPVTIDEALNNGKYSLGVVSLPGEYAFPEVIKLIDAGMHVMLFSDHVSYEDEVYLKKYAISKGKLLMGPDCGTSILDGYGICFANHVRRGNIGIISASGTGLQEVSVCIHELGGGISQAIGVGGRDLSKEVGGLMMLHAIELLEQDEETTRIVLISKPPVLEVQKCILDAISRIKTEVVVYFIDTYEHSNNSRIIYGKNLYDTAYKAVFFKEEENPLEVQRTSYAFSKTQQYIRGLYCGGTLCYEAMSTLREKGYSLFSNISHDVHEELADPTQSKGHCFIDLGDDFFTRGKPHPMIEPSIRLDRIVEEARDPETRVIILDFELGYGSHEDPVGISIDAIKKAQDIAQDEGRVLCFIGYVLGTNEDKQNRKEQEERLRLCGVHIAQSNIEAVLLADAYCRGDV